MKTISSKCFQFLVSNILQTFLTLEEIFFRSNLTYVHFKNKFLLASKHSGRLNYISAGSNILFGFTRLITYKQLEGTARYAGSLLAPAEGFSWSLINPLGKKSCFLLLWFILGHFRCSVVISVTFSSNLSNFEKIRKIQKSLKPKKKKKN